MTHIPRSIEPDPALASAITPAIKALLAQATGILKGTGERERTQRDAVVVFAVRCASAALLYLSQIVLARWMGSDEYGVYVFVWTLVLVLGSLSMLGFDITSIRFIPRYRETGDTGAAARRHPRIARCVRSGSAR